MSSWATTIVDGLVANHSTRKTSRDGDTRLADAIRSSLFPKQLQVVQDPAKRKAVLCPRRSGKSWTALAYAFDTALRKPNSMCLIICLVQKTARITYWHTLVPKFLQTYGIKAGLHHTDLRITLPNGSRIMFLGAETRAEIEKVRGGSYDLVVVDECKSYAPALLEELIQDAVKPATDDRGGTIMMIGTPGHVYEGLFYQATYPGLLDPKGKPYSRTFDAPEEYWVGKRGPLNGGFNLQHNRVRWSRHNWSRKENDRTEENLWEASLREKEDMEWPDDHPTWLAEHLGQWSQADECFVYAYATIYTQEPERVHWRPQRSPDNRSGLPEHEHWRFILGCDLGYEDDFAAVVCAYSPHDGSLYHVWDYKANHKDIYEIVDILLDASDQFGGFDAMIGDAGGLGKLVIETLNKRHGLSIQPAEKREKFDHIELLNADFRSGRIRIIPGSDLARELAGLQFDLSKHSKKELVRTGRLRENPQLPNHLTDSLLYAHRFAHHYWATPKVKQYEVGSPEAEEAYEKAWIEQALAHRNDPDSLWDNLRTRSVDPLEFMYRDHYRA